MKNIRSSLRQNRGFTLVEVMIVVVILGIVVAIVAMNMAGNTTPARVRMIQRVATTTTQNVNLISMACGTSTAVGSTPVPASGKNLTDVLYGGIDNVAAAYQTCYQQASVRPMRDAVTWNGGSWQIESYPITLTGGGTAKLGVQFDQVPDEVVLALVQKFSSNVTTLSSSDTTSDIVRYGAAAAGKRTVTLLIQ